MYKLVFAIILGILLLLGYQYYSNMQQQADDVQQNSDFELEKQALEKARSARSPQPLTEFIQQHPGSPWLDTAIYYRDKYAVEQLIKSGDVARLNNFINNNPDSEWVVQAQQSIIKIQREQENRKIQQRVLNNQSKVDLSNVKIPKLDEINNQAQPEAATRETVVQQKTEKKPIRNESAERVKRALSIYQKMGKPQIRKEEERKRQQQEEARLARICIELKDQLSQFNRRTRWYQLDDTGKRVFMSKQAVAQKKKEIRNTIKEKCE